MRLVVQRVDFAEVVSGNNVPEKIGIGFLVLLGVGNKDSETDAVLLADKLSKLRIMADQNGKMNLSLLDTKASVLVVSQFTLYSDIKDGNRPSFINAKNPMEAENIYKHFISLLEKKGISVKSGFFGEHMKINAHLDGPVTIVMDSEILK